MQAILLAGGFGTRLKGLIGELPKSMVTHQGEPFLAYYIRTLVSQGVTEVMLAVHHQAAVIQHYFQDRFEGIPITYSVEKVPLGTGGAIKQALYLMAPTSPVFVSNTDCLMDLNLRSMGAQHTGDRLLTIAVTERENCARFGQVWLDAHGRVTQFMYPGTTQAGLVSMGAYMVSSEIFSPYAMPNHFSFENDFKAPHIRTLQPRAYVHEGTFLDFGTAETFMQMQNTQVLIATSP